MTYFWARFSSCSKPSERWLGPRNGTFIFSRLRTWSFVIVSLSHCICFRCLLSNPCALPLAVSDKATLRVTIFLLTMSVVLCSACITVWKFIHNQGFYKRAFAHRALPGHKNLGIIYRLWRNLEELHKKYLPRLAMLVLYTKSHLLSLIQ